eukprot:scaffold20492_cov56-Attheya_sp.AAC.7
MHLYVSADLINTRLVGIKSAIGYLTMELTIRYPAGEFDDSTHPYAFYFYLRIFCLLLRAAPYG